MKISFFITEQDLIDLNIYDLEKYSNTKVSMIFITALMPLGLFSVFAIEYFNSNIFSWSTFFACFVVSIIWIIFYPLIVKSRLRQVILKRIRQLKNTDINKNIDLVIDDDGITKNCSGNVSKVLWSSIEKVDVTKEHIFIYADYASAFIIPIRELKDEVEKESIVEYIRKFTNLHIWLIGSILIS